jgi:hypothetical protein
VKKPKENMSSLNARVEDGGSGDNKQHNNNDRVGGVLVGNRLFRIDRIEAYHVPTDRYSVRWKHTQSADVVSTTDDDKGDDIDWDGRVVATVRASDLDLGSKERFWSSVALQAPEGHLSAQHSQVTPRTLSSVSSTTTTTTTTATEPFRLRHKCFWQGVVSPEGFHVSEDVVSQCSSLDVLSLCSVMEAPHSSMTSVLSVDIQRWCEQLLCQEKQMGGMQALLLRQEVIDDPQLPVAWKRLLKAQRLRLRSVADAKRVTNPDIKKMPQQQPSSLLSSS